MAPAAAAKTGVAATIGAILGIIIAALTIGDRLYAPASVVAAQAMQINDLSSRLQSLTQRIDNLHSGNTK
jgi:hypothetical protein